MIFTYRFEDGVVLKLYNVGLSGAEVFKLEELHGKCVGVQCEDVK